MKTNSQASPPVADKQYVRITFADPEHSRSGNYYQKGEEGEKLGINADASLIEIRLAHPYRIVLVPRGNVESIAKATQA